MTEWKKRVLKLSRLDVETTEITHQSLVDFESRIHVEISTSNRCHNFHVDLPFKIDEISRNFPRGISTVNRWRINEDVSIGLYAKHETELRGKIDETMPERIVSSYNS